MKELFSFRGRINRGTFWGISIVNAIVFGGLFVIFGGLLTVLEHVESKALSTLIIAGLLLFTLLSICVQCATCVKRLHDTNHMGCLVLIGLIPIIGGLFLLAVCGFFPGTAGPNDYGHAPPRRNLQ